jgi:hypothetical protein
MTYTLSQAARASGKGKATLLRAVRSGRISAVRDEVTGSWLIEESELSRVFPPVPPVSFRGTGDDAPRSGDRNERNNRTAELEGRIAEIVEAQRLRDEMIADLRRRLDRSDDERERLQQQLAAAQERIAALLTDQRTAPPAPARGSWWSWRRG